jgi:hypothetical protein
MPLTWWIHAQEESGDLSSLLRSESNFVQIIVGVRRERLM